MIQIQVEIAATILGGVFSAIIGFCMYLLNRISKLEDAVLEQDKTQTKLNAVLESVSDSQKELANQLHRFADKVDSITNVLTRLQTIIDRE